MLLKVQFNLQSDINRIQFYWFLPRSIHFTAHFFGARPYLKMNFLMSYKIEFGIAGRFIYFAKVPLEIQISVFEYRIDQFIRISKMFGKKIEMIIIKKTKVNVN